MSGWPVHWRALLTRRRIDGWTFSQSILGSEPLDVVALRTGAVLAADEARAESDRERLAHLSVATSQLGRADESTTMRHFAGRTHMAPDLRSVIDEFVIQARVEGVDGWKRGVWRRPRNDEGSQIRRFLRVRPFAWR